MTGSKPSGHALVIGAGVAGLLSARVLAERFERVTVVDRDPLDEHGVPRKGVPQGRHPHALLARGGELLEGLFPGLTAELVAAGAELVDMAATPRWWQPGGYRLPFDSGRSELMLSRPLLEAHVRRRVCALADVAILGERTVCGLLSTSDRACITGVTVQRSRGDSDPRPLRADLVVDAAGRGTHAPTWLAEHGYRRPAREQIRIGVHYTTRLYARRPCDLAGAPLAVAQSTPPHERRFGVMLPIEHSRWLVLLGGFLGERAPTDPDGFVAFARSLPTPDIADVIRDAEPLGPAATYAFPAQQRHRYERLRRLPDGYLVLGDALCAFNPVYAQGMTVAALQADALSRCLADQRPGLPRRFYRHAARAIEPAWRLSAGADFAYPEVTGRRAPGTALMNRYVGQLQRAATADPHACRALVDVTRMLAPAGALFRPRAAAAVLRGAVAGPRVRSSVPRARLAVLEPTDPPA
jgi:2-polyprenyl-6-methoxyphenol hydroxylase-like FAD-dependent oxidoreductase